MSQYMRKEVDRTSLKLELEIRILMISREKLGTLAKGGLNPQEKKVNYLNKRDETELERQREKKKVHVSDSFGKLILPTPSMAKLEAYFAGTITECPYYNGKN